MSDYILSEQAREDIKAVWTYISADNPKSADRIMDELLALLDKLSEMPKMGHSRSDLTSKPLRFFNFYSYLVIYNADSIPIEIVRFLSGYRDIETLL